MSDERYCGNVELLMSYLYEEGDGAERRAFEAHLASCESCASEVRGMREVRGSLQAWAPPDTVLDFRIVRGPAPAAVPLRRPWFSIPQIPAWAQFAAASLVVGIAVGISGLEVRYDQQGLTVRAGWSKPAAAPTGAASAVANGAVTPVAAPAEAPWRAELAALEQRLREQYAQPVSGSAPGMVAASAGPARRGMSDDEFLGRVRELINASETRQQRELAVRLTQVVRDMDTQHRVDLARVADNFGILEGRTGAAVAQQREMLNYLVRVSQKQQ